MSLAESFNQMWAAGLIWSGNLVEEELKLFGDLLLAVRC
jgi:hypothetical protein